MFATKTTQACHRVLVGDMAECCSSFHMKSNTFRSTSGGLSDLEPEIVRSMTLPRVNCCFYFPSASEIIPRDKHLINVPKANRVDGHWPCPLSLISIFTKLGTRRHENSRLVANYLTIFPPRTLSANCAKRLSCYIDNVQERDFFGSIVELKPIHLAQHRSFCSSGTNFQGLKSCWWY